MFQVIDDSLYRRSPNDTSRFARRVELVSSRGWFTFSWFIDERASIAFLATVKDVVNFAESINKPGNTFFSLKYHQLTQELNIEESFVTSVSEIVTASNQVEGYLVDFFDGSAGAFPLHCGMMSEGQQLRAVLKSDYEATAAK